MPCDDFLTYLNPEPHRRTFMKPFMREQRAEFCSTCHKVHLDVPVNHYRWVRGFNDYDNWQASGVSGQGARSFYYPAKAMDCADCHMPLVNSHDPGNRQGKVHSHRFPAANTALAYVNQDQEQLRAETRLPEIRIHHRDIFAVSPAGDRPVRMPMLRRTDSMQANSTFAVGEEAEQNTTAVIREVGQRRRSHRRGPRCASSPAPPRAWMWWCGRARSATSSRAERWMRSMSGWNCRPRTRMAA